MNTSDKHGLLKRDVSPVFRIIAYFSRRGKDAVIKQIYRKSDRIRSVCFYINSNRKVNQNIFFPNREISMQG